MGCFLDSTYDLPRWLFFYTEVHDVLTHYISPLAVESFRFVSTRYCVLTAASTSRREVFDPSVDTTFVGNRAYRIRSLQCVAAPDLLAAAVGGA